MEHRIIPLLAALLFILTLPASSQNETPLTLEKAIEGSTAPPEITRRLVLISVDYYTMQGELQRGQIVADSSLREDIDTLFAFARQIRYPMDMVIPVRFDLPDNGTSMSDLNNCYSFHYRKKVGANSSLSLHSYGSAIDINPYNNPYISSSGEVIPRGAARLKSDPRTLSDTHPLVLKFQQLGWTWGGSWTDPKDYMHFQKPLTIKE